MKNTLVTRNRKIEVSRETLRQLQAHEYAKATVVGRTSPSFSRLPHCPLCCP